MRRVRSILAVLLVAAAAGCTDELDLVAPPATYAAAADVRALEANCSPAALTEFDGR